jgi:triosephosphate isomerase
MRQLIVGNWKMHGLLDDAARILGPLRHGADGVARDLVVCPPATILSAVAHILVGSVIDVGGQDCHADATGPHTGDVSAEMLRDAGARWVILGHSERRTRHGETDAVVRAKVAAAGRAGLHAIVCVGETEEERRAGAATEVVARQLDQSLPEGFAGTVAYEPLWAIGSGRVPDEAEVAEMHGHIRGQIGAGVRILYGGSVKPDNAAAILRVADVDGALVGGASLDPAAFLAIASAASPGAARGLERAAVPGKPS